MEDYLREEGDPELELEEDFIYLDDWENHRKDVIVVSNEEKDNVHTMRWEVYMRDKEELKNKHFSVAVPNMKGGNIVWTCFKDNITGEKEEYKEIGL